MLIQSAAGVVLKMFKQYKKNKGHLRLTMGFSLTEVTVAAVIFAVTCILLTILSNQGSKSVLDDYSPAADTLPAQKPTPAAPTDGVVAPQPESPQKK